MAWANLSKNMLSWSFSLFAGLLLLLQCVLFLATAVLFVNQEPSSGCARQSGRTTSFMLQCTLSNRIQGLCSKGWFTNFVVGHEFYPVTEALYSRLSETDIEMVQKALPYNINFAKDHVEFKRHVIGASVNFKVYEVLDKLGLDAAEPPEEVHALSRGMGFTTGGLYEADHILEALNFVNVSIDSLNAILDFGGSSGRVSRVFSVAWPQKTWWMCDPNTESVNWAKENVIGAKVFVSPKTPPMDFSPSSLDLVFALSIWTHYGSELAADWLAETHRLLKRGGYMVFTVQGYHSFRSHHRNGQYPTGLMLAAQKQLLEEGHWFSGDYGSAGDWGVVNPKKQWGTAFVTQNWVVNATEGLYNVLYFGYGSQQDNQDIYVLQKIIGS